MSINRKIARATVIIAFYTILGKLLLMAREMATAACFGVGDLLDAYLMALVAPTFLINTLGLALSAAFLPTFVQVKKCESLASAQKLFSTVLTLSLGFLLLFSAGMILGAPVWLSWLTTGFDPEKTRLTLMLFYWTMPQLLLRCLMSLIRVILNAEERFGMAAVVPALVPLGELSALWLILQTWGIYALALGALCGCVAQTILLIISLGRQGIRLRLGWQPGLPAVKKVVEQFLPMLLAGTFWSSNFAINQIFASWLLSGSITSLNFGSKLIFFLSQLVVLSLGTSMLTYFSQQAAVNDYRGIANTLNKYVMLAAWLMIPLATFLFIFAEPLVTILFQRGQFNADNTVLVSQVFRFFSLMLPSQAIGWIGVQIISAFKSNRVLTMIAGSNMIFHIIFCYILSNLWGVAGIALATSLTFSILAGLVLLGLKVRFSIGLARSTWIQLGLWSLVGVGLSLFLTAPAGIDSSIWNIKVWNKVFLWALVFGFMAFFSLHLQPWRYWGRISKLIMKKDLN